MAGILQENILVSHWYDCGHSRIFALHLFRIIKNLLTIYFPYNGGSVFCCVPDTTVVIKEKADLIFKPLDVTLFRTDLDLVKLY